MKEGEGLKMLLEELAMLLAVAVQEVFNTQ